MPSFFHACSAFNMTGTTLEVHRGTIFIAWELRVSPLYLGVSNIGIPQNGWFIMEIPMKMDDLGVPLFKETPISYIVHR